MLNRGEWVRRKDNKAELGRMKEKSNKVGNREMKRVGSLPEFISTGEAAQLLGYNRQTVTRLCQAGKIPAKKIIGEWRIKKSDLRRMIEGEEGDG
jgi:excisionase family DNA binding protein